MIREHSIEIEVDDVTASLSADAIESFGNQVEKASHSALKRLRPELGQTIRVAFVLEEAKQ